MFSCSILPQKVVEERGEDFGSNPVGAGAFRLKEWRRGEVLIIERNPHYWEEGLPIVDGVEWHVVSEDNTRILEVQAGKLDAALAVPFNRIGELEANPDIPGQSRYFKPHRSPAVEPRQAAVGQRQCPQGNPHGHRHAGDHRRGDVRLRQAG